MHRLKNHFRLRAKRKLRQRPRRAGRRALVALAALSFGALASAHGESVSSLQRPASTQPAAETPEARLARWKDSFDAFAEADREHAPVAGGVLFVGSSSIRLWDSLEEDFQSLPVVIKRGFGGSRLSDCSDQVARLVLPYKPATVIVYAGDNDLAEGATPQDVLASFRRFVESVRNDLPATRIAYLSIKPSPLRAALIEQIRETNTLIAAYTATVPGLDYIDVYSKMIGADGAPRSELFRPDMLHLNAAGYALWKTAITSTLGPVSARRPAAGAMQAGPMSPVAPLLVGVGAPHVAP